MSGPTRGPASGPATSRPAARADLHVHSRHSDRPSEWLLRRIGAPESFSEPAEVYRKCRQRGMDFVTISDHDCIDGALEIAHLPGTFLSVESTVSFPEDGCKIHCLVIGLTEDQFRDVQELRSDIYAFRDYLYEQDLPYSVAHPLFRVNDQLTVEHLEKLLVLFKRFEGINGTRDPRAADIFRTLVDHLTPEILDRLAERHGLDPRDDQPWVKHLTAGSDDHSGLYVASAWTETPPAETVGQFLHHLRRGQHRPVGPSGSSLHLARSFYSIAYQFYRHRLGEGAGRGSDLFAELLDVILGGKGPGELSGATKVRLAARRLFAFSGGGERAGLDLLAELEPVLREARDTAPQSVDAAPEERCFQIASGLAGRLGSASVTKALRHVGEGRLMDALQDLAALGPVVLSVAPYLAAFHTQNKDEAMLQAVAEHFSPEMPALAPLRRKGRGKAWFTDTYGEVNGVARTLRTTAAIARRRGEDLRVITCLPGADPAETSAAREAGELGRHLERFEPLARLPMPEYETLELSYPPVLEMVEHCEREGYGEVVISTPGPVGLAGLLAGRLLGLKVTGIYHTDFPRYVRYLTGSPGLGDFTWAYMRWFFDSMDRLYVPSDAYRRQLAARGFEEAKLRILPRGVDRRLFHPGRRDPAFYRRRGLEDGFRFLYVGRISKEKNLDALLADFGALRQRRPEARLVLVGDGPYRRRLEERHDRSGVLFTGLLHGEELAAAYASADAFVFPSTTDTFGNAVLEAQACRLPAVVSDRGGPQEIVAPPDGGEPSGLVVDVTAPGALRAAMERLLADTVGRERMARLGLERARERRLDALFEALWRESPDELEAERLAHHLSIRDEDRQMAALASAW